MADRNELKAMLKTNTGSLLQMIAHFPHADWNKRPAEGKWSPGEIADHILLTDNSIHQLFNGPSVVATDRVPLSKEKLIKEVFLDHTRKLKAFGPIIPKEGEKVKESLIREIKQVRGSLNAFLDHATTSELCMSFSHGKFGLLTKFEWIYFMIYHTERHLIQMESLIASNEK